MSSLPLSLNLSGPFTPTSQLGLIQYRAVSPPERRIQKGTRIECADIWGVDGEERRVLNCLKVEGGHALVECGKRDAKTGMITDQFCIVFDAGDVNIPIPSNPAHSSFLARLLSNARSIFCLGS